MDQVFVRVPTAALKALLADHPEVEVRLEDMACEKIAEEIMRKVNARKGGIVKSVEDQVDRVVKVRLAALEDSYCLPPETTKAVTDKVGRAVKEELLRREWEFDRHVADLATKTVDDMVARAAALLQERVAEQARSEFFRVLKEARTSA